MSWNFINHIRISCVCRVFLSTWFCQSAAVRGQRMLQCLVCQDVLRPAYVFLNSFSYMVHSERDYSHDLKKEASQIVVILALKPSSEKLCCVPQRCGSRISYSRSSTQYIAPWLKSEKCWDPLWNDVSLWLCSMCLSTR